jgi:prepilin-type N-terminal cleavage/methylation domain-containing protein
MRASQRRRGGFTLVEVMISMMLLLVVMGAATTFFRVQLRALGSNSGRFDAQQNSTYAINLLDQEIRAAGVGMPNSQPLIVQASPDAITFNGDLVTRPAGDVASVYYDPDASPLATDNLARGNQITLPLSTNTYPGAAFEKQAETISYWVTADTVSNRSDELMLMRRVNAMAPRLVARGVKRVAGQPIFSYFSKSGDPDNGGYVPITTITTASPAFHTDTIHTDPARESAGSRLVDAIVMVRVQMTTIYRDARGDSATRTVTRNVRVMNAGLTDQDICGGTPAPPTAANVPSNIRYADAGGVTLTWNASVDQAGGARDVQRYLIFKRKTTDVGGFTEAFKVIPADGILTFFDPDVQAGNSYYYGVAAQDCGLATSAIVSPNNAVQVRP